MENLKKQYRDLEMRVLNELRNLVESSKVNSKFVDSKAIRVNKNGKTELVIVNDQLTFIDPNGHHYSIWADFSLEDLIDLLN